MDGNDCIYHNHKREREREEDAKCGVLDNYIETFIHKY
jgi:hypothetical protein